MHPNEITTLMSQAGGDCLPPTLAAAVRRVLARLQYAPDGMQLLPQPRSRELALTSSTEASTTLRVDVPFILWGLRGGFKSDDSLQRDSAEGVRVNIELPSKLALVGDSAQGLNLSALVDAEEAWPLHPPVLIVPNAPLTIRARPGTLYGTEVTAIVHFYGISLHGCSIS